MEIMKLQMASVGESESDLGRGNEVAESKTQNSERGRARMQNSSNSGPVVAEEMRRWRVSTSSRSRRQTVSAHELASTIDVFAVQCDKCHKWRVISTEEEYEEIRYKQSEDPFVCSKKITRTCEDPPDIVYDSSRTWVIDKPNLPKTPSGFQRKLILRKDYSKMDVHYITPEGKKVRATPGMAAYLEQNPGFNLSISDFSFKSPRIMDDTVPENVARKSPPSSCSSSTKKVKTSSEKGSN